MSITIKPDEQTILFTGAPYRIETNGSTGSTLYALKFGFPIDIDLDRFILLGIRSRNQTTPEFREYVLDCINTLFGEYNHPFVIVGWKLYPGTNKVIAIIKFDDSYIQACWFAIANLIVSVSGSDNNNQGLQIPFFLTCLEFSNGTIVESDDPENIETRRLLDNTFDCRDQSNQIIADKLGLDTRVDYIGCSCPGCVMPANYNDDRGDTLVCIRCYDPDNEHSCHRVDKSECPVCSS